MIIGKEFIWLHFPRCAGTKIERIFRDYYSNTKDIIQDPVGIKVDPSVAWHDSIAEREKRDPSFSLGSRTIICSFRKLPSWLESRYNFEVLRNSDQPHDPEELLRGRFLERGGYQNNADFYAKKYLPENIMENHHVKFLRVEFFEMDFKRIFGSYLDLSVIPDSEFQIKINAASSCLSQDFIKRLYENTTNLYGQCPYWSSIENIAYR